MTNNRFDLYTSIHKAIRQILFDLSTWEGRTDFDDVVSARRLDDRVSSALDLLQEHARHEDREMLPVLLRTAPEVHAKLTEEHGALERLAEELSRAVSGIADRSVGDRVTSGATVHVLVNRLVAGHLAHMEREERDGNAALWNALRDDELLAIHKRILGAVPAARMAEWSQWMMPALNSEERDKVATARAMS